MYVGASIPDIISSLIRVSVNKTSVSLSVVFDSDANQPGTLYCAAFAPTFQIVSADDVIAQGAAVSYRLRDREAFLVISSLSPSTQYSIYCALKSLDGTVTSLLKTLQTLVESTTLCCKTISWGSVPAFTFNDGSPAPGSSNIYSFVLSSLPSQNLGITPFVEDSNGQALPRGEYIVSPASRNFSNLTISGSTSSTFSLLLNTSSVVGAHFVKLTISGDSRLEYESIALQVFVLDKLSGVIPQPKVVLAIFSNGGSRVFVRFDSPTDRGGIIASTWPCSFLFDLEGADTLYCSWMNATTISIQLPSSINSSIAINPGSNLTIFIDRIGPQCATLSECSSFTRSSSATSQSLRGNFASHGVEPAISFQQRLLQSSNRSLSISISPPLNPRVPTPVLVITGIVLSCTSFAINPTQSTGNANRAWLRVAWAVSSLDNSTSAMQLQNYLVAFSNTSGVIMVPQFFLQPGTYFVSLSLTNIFGVRGSTTVSFLYQTQVIAPIVTLTGSTDQYFRANEVIRVFSNTGISTCGSNNLTASVVLRWQCIARNNNAAAAAGCTSSSKNPRVFEIAAGSLLPGVVYRVQVLAFLTSSSGFLLSAVNTTAAINILIMSGRVVAVIPGGNNRFVSNDTVLSSSQSYDEDFVATNSRTSQFAFLWSCSFTSPLRFGLPCNEIFSSQSSLTADTVTVLYGGMSVDDEYSVTVVAVAADGRSGSTSVTLTKLATNNGVSSAATIRSTFEAVNTQFPISIFGSVQASSAVTAMWQGFIGDVEINLQPMSRTPLRRNFTSNFSASTIAFPLQLNADSSLNGNSASFRLSTFQQGTTSLLSATEISVVLTPPPTGGILTATPSEGVSFSQNFIFVTSLWIDDSGSSYPLQYDFRYLTSSASPTPLSIQSQSALTTASGTLPSGLAEEDFKVTIIVRAFNSFGAFGTATTQVVTTRPIS
ncbi:hypothetical protein EON65_42720, partial [archaeon]